MGALVALVGLAWASVGADSPIRYNGDVRPILAENCFACHGPDRVSRKADLRLDLRQAALDSQAIVAGKPGESEMISRIFSTEPGEQMPPPASHKKLTSAQKELLKRWIAAGAEYQPHWSFIAPSRPKLPAVKNAAWCKSAIDFFVLEKLEAIGLAPAPEADRPALVRRLYLDLTGLPPSAADADSAPDHDEQLVDRLMATPQWGEHRARFWLDAARYADTHGIHFDNYREMWSYRDWVIEAFNRNQPFDQFTLDQLAGDLLPNPTLDQRVATGFNRCNITTNEGGTIPEENLVLYTRDRTETTAQVWLGLTAGCAVCHDHKFDPISQKDFYQMAAFFNNTTQGAMDGNVKDTPPTILVPRTADRRRWDVLEKLNDKPYQDSAGREAEVARERSLIRSRATVAHVTQERPEAPRAWVLFRGEYDKRREEVAPNAFSCLPPMSADVPKNRLGLARWLLRPEHPLTARVTVNRIWQEIFGQGLVRTAGDFGATGEMPSHPELLDWLAVEFRESGWDVKRLVRLLVTSATYRQAALTSPEKLEKDPQNRLLSRGPRFRMDAEMVRDYALGASGLLVRRIGGPSVKPCQPPGVWEAVAMIGSDTRDYREDTGEGLYRRSLYTFWKRAAPPASMEIFNAPSREVCTVRRERTNTPLQALVTLNDPQFVEAARRLAGQVLAARSTDACRIAHLAKHVLCRPLRPQETQVLQSSLARLLCYYRAHADEARRLVAVGASKPGAGLDPTLLAGWTMLANELLNLDEVLNK